MDILPGEATLSNMFCLPSEKWSTLRGNNLLIIIIGSYFIMCKLFHVLCSAITDILDNMFVTCSGLDIICRVFCYYMLMFLIRKSYINELLLNYTW